MTLMKNLRQHESVIAIDYDDWTDFPDIDKSDGEDESKGFNIVNRYLIDFNVVSNGDSDQIFVPLVTVESLLLPPQQCYSICFHDLWNVKLLSKTMRTN